MERKKKVLFILLLLSNFAFSQEIGHLFEKSAKEDLKTVTSVFQIDDQVKGEVFNLLYRKYKWYYGFSEIPSDANLKSYKTELYDLLIKLLLKDGEVLNKNQDFILNKILEYNKNFNK